MKTKIKTSLANNWVIWEVIDFCLIFFSIVVLWMITMNYKAVYLATFDVFNPAKDIVLSIPELKEEDTFIKTVDVWNQEEWDDIYLAFSKIWRDEDIMSESLQSDLQKYQYPLNLLPPGRRILIPSLSVDAPIVSVRYVSDEKLMNGDFDEELRNGVVQYPLTANPWEIGTWLLFGHSSVSERWDDKNNPYGYVFRKLSTLEEWERYSLIWDWIVYEYKIDHKEIVRPEEVAWKIEAYDDMGWSTMTTMACYPLFSDAQRVLVRAKLLSTSGGKDALALKKSNIPW